MTDQPKPDVRDPREENLAAAMKTASALCAGLIKDMEGGPLRDGVEVREALGRLDQLAIRAAAVAEGVSIVGDRARSIVATTLDGIDMFVQGAEEAE